MPLAVPALVPSALSSCILWCSLRALGPKGRRWQESAVCVLCEWHDEYGDLTQQQAIEAEKFICSMVSISDLIQVNWKAK